MLQSLTIKNIALIDNLTIELNGGFNVLTGETGAGKSLIIDSLALLLGEKADKSLISYGTDFASVEAVFYTNQPGVLNRLEEFGLERENTIIIYRKLSLDGRNECRVNGKSFTLSMLKTITSPLMDLHGQFQHQELLKTSNQLLTLDDFGGSKLASAKKDYQECFYKLKQIKKQLSSFNFDSRDREKLLDMYSFQISERIGDKIMCPKITGIIAVADTIRSDTLRSDSEYAKYLPHHWPAVLLSDEFHLPSSPSLHAVLSFRHSAAAGEYPVLRLFPLKYVLFLFPHHFFQNFPSAALLQ